MLIAVPERSLHGHGTLDEQPHSLEPHDRVRGVARIQSGHGKWRDRIDVQGLAARGKDADPRPRLEQLPRKLGACGYEMLAVVENQ